MKNSLSILLFLTLGCKQLPDYTLSKENPEINKSRKATILSAFFGLDNAMPLKSIGIWSKAPGKDGMPLVFSHEIDPATLNQQVFKITTQKGNKLNVLLPFQSYKMQTLLRFIHFLLLTLMIMTIILTYALKKKAHPF